MKPLSKALGLSLFMLILACCAQFKGQTGDQGIAGTPTPVYSAPADLLQCPTGGVAVTIGTNITVVCNGADDTDSTPVTMVQFCSGTPTYPSVFIEWGLCIDNEIYGVYSANGGFLTKILPGAYLSDAIGSTCNFTVLDNCRISN